MELQKEIRLQRRNVGALKLSNLLQLDRFEEDLNISKIRLHVPTSIPSPKPVQALAPVQLERRRLAALEHFRKITQQLR